jgi:hypothetical protein
MMGESDSVPFTRAGERRGGRCPADRHPAPRPAADRKGSLEDPERRDTRGRRPMGSVGISTVAAEWASM